jgi:hypothetical protein
MGGVTGEVCKTAPGCGRVQLELVRAGHDAWVVVAPEPDQGDPPLRVMFHGSNAYNDALEFYLQCDIANPANGPANPVAPEPCSKRITRY